MKKIQNGTQCPEKVPCRFCKLLIPGIFDFS